MLVFCQYVILYFYAIKVYVCTVRGSLGYIGLIEHRFSPSALKIPFKKFCLKGIKYSFGSPYIFFFRLNHVFSYFTAIRRIYVTVARWRLRELALEVENAGQILIFLHPFNHIPLASLELLLIYIGVNEKPGSEKVKIAVITIPSFRSPTDPLRIAQTINYLGNWNSRQAQHLIFPYCMQLSYQAKPGKDAELPF